MVQQISLVMIRGRKNQIAHSYWLNSTSRLVSSLYYQLKGLSDEDLMLMNLIDHQYLLTPFYGARRMAVELTRQTVQ